MLTFMSALDTFFNFFFNSSIEKRLILIVKVYFFWSQRLLVTFFFLVISPLGYVFSFRSSFFCREKIKPIDYKIGTYFPCLFVFNIRYLRKVKNNNDHLPTRIFVFLPL
uniref:Uncharacterized protein n=1 Tax=Cacopsylla melanoneura TaxID=428564 RepID=A0A8D8M6A5_9HEMI